VLYNSSRVARVSKITNAKTAAASIATDIIAIMLDCRRGNILPIDMRVISSRYYK
jgi:hypothetical protein